MKKRPIFFVLLLSFLFISCENLLSPKDSYNNGDGKTYTITGDINIEGALPNELFNENSTNSVARTGFPTVPNILDSDLNLSVSATNADSSSTIEGTINAETKQYSINLPIGQWTITVSGKKSDVVILEGSVTVVLNDEYPVTNSEIIILKPKTTGGKGNLSLKLALHNESIICGGVKATLSSSEEEPETKYILFTDSDGNPASKIDLIFNDIPSGTYSFNLEFYKSMTPNGPDNYEYENIIYILNDTVNIFDGLTTNEWSGTGYSKTTFTLTKEMIKSFAMTTVYVSENGDDSNLGTFFEPVRTIQTAVDKVIAMNVITTSREETPYKILLLSDIETSSNNSFENTNNALVNIDPSSTSETPLYLTISKYGDGKATIDAKRTEFDTGRVMYIGENANVTLQNLILTGGYLEDKNGAGVYLAGGTFTMNGGAVISSDNDVYLANGTTITVTGNLTSTDTVATITPNEYSTTRQVLVAGSGVNFTDKIVNRFLVTQENSNEWYVTVNGKLQEMEKDANGYLGREPRDQSRTTETETTEYGDVVLTKVSCSIESYDNMLWIAHGLKTSTIHKFDIKLTNDIEIPSGKWQFNQLNVDYASTIDGQGHSITIDEDVSKFGNDAGGLFYKFNNSTVKNLVLKGSITANTSADGYIGALCRSAYRTTIQNVMSTVEIIDEGSGNAGGLVGYFGGNKKDAESTPGSFIQNCAVYANIKSTNGTVGGLVGGTWDGYQCWQINNCIYAGTVDGGADQGEGAIIGTHNTGRRSTFKDTWYCANGTSRIVGKCNNDGNGENFDGYEGTVISKTSVDIASEAAATLLNTNSDGTANDVWEYIPGSAYPTL